MLEKFFADKVVLNGIRNSVLFDSLENFTFYLLDRGHTPRMMKEYSSVAVHFVYWLESNKVSLPMIGEEITRSFYIHLPQCHCPVRFSYRPRVRAGMVHLLHVLRTDGHIAPEPQKPKTPIDCLIDEYKMYLKKTHGVTISTCRQYTWHARNFLISLYGKHPLELTCLTVQDIVEHVTHRAKLRTFGTGTLKALVTAIRSFLRYLAYRGLCDMRLVNAVPTVAHWKLASLPKHLSKEQLTAFLGAFDQSTALGRRDFAIALTLAQLGLRAGEVASLCLDDIDWRKGTLRIHHGKSKRVNTLPLPADVGRVMVNYIRHDRPASQRRNIFLRHRPNVGDAIKSGAVSAIVRKAFKRSGITVASLGSHILRHTAATRLVQAGVSIKKVADILGHRNMNTTCIYAKVDLPALASVALPWPEVQ